MWGRRETASGRDTYGTNTLHPQTEEGAIRVGRLGTTATCRRIPLSEALTRASGHDGSRARRSRNRARDESLRECPGKSPAYLQVFAEKTFSSSGALALHAVESCWTRSLCPVFSGLCISSSLSACAFQRLAASLLHCPAVSACTCQSQGHSQPGHSHPLT